MWGRLVNIGVLKPRLCTIVRPYTSTHTPYTHTRPLDPLITVSSTVKLSDHVLRTQTWYYTNERPKTWVSVLHVSQMVPAFDQRLHRDLERAAAALPWCLAFGIRMYSVITILYSCSPSILLNPSMYV